MKNFCKKTIALLLTLGILFSVFSIGSTAAPAAESPTASAETALMQTVANAPNPVIVVPGIGMSAVALFDDEGNQIRNDGAFPDTWNVLNLYTGDLMANLWKIVPKFLLSIALQRDIGLSDTVRDYLPGAFKYSAHNNMGESIENVRAIERNYPLSQYEEGAKNSFYNMMPMRNFIDLIGEDRVYCFNFPPFSSTYEHAARLDEFVQMVKAQTGSQKVNLVALSLGATVTNAYFDDYAYKNDVAKVVNVVASSNGSLVFADLVGQNYSDKSAELFYKDMMPQLIKGWQGYLVNLAMRILPKKVFNNILDAAFEVVREHFFRNIPSMWATVPSERYEEYANILLSDPDHAHLRSLTDKYYNYQRNLEQNIHALVADGVDIYNICGYGWNFGHGWRDYQYFQFFKCADDINSDGIIQVSSTGMGAFSAAPGTTFPTGYEQQNTNCTIPGHNHISPDRTIDASTCYLPDRTWFFAGQHHEIADNDVAVALACTLLLTNTIDNVYSDPAFPQFNGSRYVKRITRDYLPKAIVALERTDLSAADRAELQGAIDAANAMLASTVADDDECVAIEARLFNILVKVGVYEAPTKPALWETVLEKSLKGVSDFLYKKFGPRGYSEFGKAALASLGF